MAIRLIPYGKLADGKHGFALENGTSRPLAAVIEVETSLPAVDSADNFPGRLIFDQTTQVVYVFRTSPDEHWRPVDGVAVIVDSGEPSASPTPGTGELYYDTDTQVLYMWDGVEWGQVGGNYAASVIERQYIGDGTTTTFSTGATGVLSVQYVEAFWDTARQYPTSDYISIGNNVQFVTAPPSGVKVFLRTLVSGNVSANAQTFEQRYTGNGVSTSFDVGAQAAGSANVFVFENYQIRREGTHYNLVSQNTTITNLSRSGTTATATTQVAHGLSIGAVVTIAGASPSGWNGSYTVATVPTSQTFTFTINTNPTTPATSNPAIYYTPAVQNDSVVFVSPPANGVPVDIRVIKSVIGGPQVGEANTISSVGTGLSLVSGKVGVDLQLKSLANGANTTIVDQGNSLRIDVNSLNLFENRVAINTANYTVTTNDSYVAVQNTSFPVVIDLTDIPVSSGQAGRRLIIGDESGGAALNNITITTGGTIPINGSTLPITITTNYGYVHLTYDGSQWFIRGRA